MPCHNFHSEDSGVIMKTSYLCKSEQYVDRTLLLHVPKQKHRGESSLLSLAISHSPFVVLFENLSSGFDLGIVCNIMKQQNLSECLLEIRAENPL